MEGVAVGVCWYVGLWSRGKDEKEGKKRGPKKISLTQVWDAELRAERPADT